MVDVYIVIPARYDSSRLPGKPLREIKGKKMVERVAEIAAYVCKYNVSCSYTVATDHEEIEMFCANNKIPVIMTPKECETGTARCFEAIRTLTTRPKLIINLQGDNPLCPPYVIQKLIDTWKEASADVYTPCIKLNWNEYDQLVIDKEKTPYSGTTVLVTKNGYAMAFSKKILPAIRKLDQAKAKMTDSPVRRHVGLYAYTYGALEQYSKWNSVLNSVYGQTFIEGLEQMMFLENGLSIKAVDVIYQGRRTTGGVDAEEDISRVESIIEEFGEFDLSSPHLLKL